MSTQTSIYFLNANHPDFVAAKEADDKESEDNYGTFENNPGYCMDCDHGRFYKKTDEEYGGWIVDLSNLPPGTTHIKIERG